ncbi:hypothetical protein N0V82_006097 [Gnomoniopsis sp. IMI 355080]|nr:hypothetical protein N0V82_006097 [Gnomoniopsis sp. IMI 355080]
MSKTANNMTTFPQRSASDVNHLQVVVPNKGDFALLAPGSAVFNCTAAVVSMALDMLECRASVLVLKDITRQIRDLNPLNVELRNIGEAQIEPKIRDFLASIRKSFPHVLVTDENCMVYKNGRTTKRDCTGAFNPKTAAVIELNHKLMQRMVTCYKTLLNKDSQMGKEHFRTIHLRLSITMAHELVHLYNLYLRRQRSQHTPPDVTYGGYGDKRTGESGRYWERRIFGGVVEMRDNSDKMEIIGIRDTNYTKCSRITTEAINGILARDLNRWLEPGSPLIELEHKPAGTARIDAFKWRTNYFECLPTPPDNVQGPPELSGKQIIRLVGSGMLASASYSLCGQDLRAFAREPRTRLRQVQA